MTESNDMEQFIRIKLTESFKPTLLEIKNESALHQGHKDSPNTGQSHFYVKLQAAALNSLSRLEQQRWVYKVLEEALKNGLHALRLEIIN